MSTEPIDIPQNESEPDTTAGSVVPCEICDAMVPFGSYARHLESCITNRLFSISFVIDDSNRRVRSGQESDEEAEAEGDAELSSTEDRAQRSAHAAEVNDFIETAGRSPSNILTGSSFRDFADQLFRGYRPPQVQPRDSPANNALNVVFVNLGQGVMGMTTPSEYELNMQLAERMGRVEVGIEDIDTVSELILDNSGCDPDAICPICQDTFLNIEEPRRKLTCGHIYCDPCISKWLSNHKKCPVCSTTLGV